MSNAIIVHKGRTNVVTVNLGVDVTADTITSEIRAQPDVESPLIATWNVVKAVGTTGELTLTLDNTVTSQISASGGFMDIKRVTGSEPVPVFDRPLEVIFRGTVTQ